MARCSHTGLLLICLSQFSGRSRLPRVVENLLVPKGRRRERDRQHAQQMARDLLRRTGFIASDAPSVDPEIRDPTNSPDRVELPGYPQLRLGQGVVIGGLTPLSLVAVMRHHLNQPGDLI